MFHEGKVQQAPCPYGKIGNSLLTRELPHPNKNYRAKCNKMSRNMRQYGVKLCRVEG